MIRIKTKQDIAILKEGGRRLANILKKVAKEVRPGVSAWDLNIFAEDLIKKEGDIPAFKGYRPDLHARAFPASLCVSVNGEVVHGIPTKKKILKKGDIVSIDLGIKHRNFFTDHAITVPVGEISDELKELLMVTKKALTIGVSTAKAGNTVGDIGHAIESYVAPYGFGIVRELAGHGVGYAIHEDPYVPNYGKAGTGAVLKEGMVIAIEPMLTLGKRTIKVLPDGYTIVTRDGKCAAHFEHTVLVTKTGGVVLTKI